MLIMRTYALYDRSRKILIVQICVTLTAIGLGAVGVSAVVDLLLKFCQYAVASGKKSSPDETPTDVTPFIGCSTSLTKDSYVRR